MRRDDMYDGENNFEGKTDLITGQSFNLLIGLVLLWGFFVNYLMVKFIDTSTLLQTNIYIIMIGYFVSCLIGMVLYTKSDKPLISFLGYNFVVIPFGLIINIVVSSYQPEIVLDAIVITGVVTLIMVIMGTLFPQFFQKISGALSIALIAVVIVEMVQIFVFKSHPAIMDWIVALLFCGYIGYDWGKANRMKKTVDNAIDGAAAIYMDIINLFLRVLRILGRSND